MKAANLTTSLRLQAVAAFLDDGMERSTLDIIQATGYVAVNSIVAELRQNGLVIDCRRIGKAWVYRRDTARESARASLPDIWHCARCH